jgi:hypothetical protein
MRLENANFLKQPASKTLFLAGEPKSQNIYFWNLFVNRNGNVVLLHREIKEENFLQLLRRNFASLKGNKKRVKSEE